jgi:hypothetical protein
MRDVSTSPSPDCITRDRCASQKIGSIGTVSHLALIYPRPPLCTSTEFYPQHKRSSEVLLRNSFAKGAARWSTSGRKLLTRPTLGNID